jgi:ribosomal protein S7
MTLLKELRQLKEVFTDLDDKEFEAELERNAAKRGENADEFATKMSTVEDKVDEKEAAKFRKALNATNPYAAIRKLNSAADGFEVALELAAAIGFLHRGTTHHEEMNSCREELAITLMDEKEQEFNTSVKKYEHLLDAL